MFQKTITFRSALVLLVLCLSMSCTLGVTASAASYKEIDVSDYVSGKEYSGNDVIVTYDLPLRPYTELYAFATGSTLPELISEYNGNLYFYQDTIDETWSYFDESLLLDMDDAIVSDAGGDLICEWQLQFDYGVLFECTALRFDEEYHTIQWDDIDDAHESVRGIVDDLTLIIVYDGYRSILTMQWPNTLQTRDIGFGDLIEVADVAEYQRINGNMFPLGKTNGATNMIDVSDIRSGYGFTLSFDLSFTIDHDSESDLDGNVATFDAVWLDKNQEEVDRSQFEIDLIPYRDHANLQYDIDFTVPEGAAFFYLRLNTGYFYVNTAYEFSWVFRNISMTTTLSSIEENSQTMGKVVYKLDELDGKLDGVIDGLGDVKDVLQSTNDKLDNMQGSIDKLPDEFGDEIQNVIDKEEQENTSAGQEFVDQILEVLPDSSIEILAALKSLPDAMSYTGTDAVLKIPGITMPAIGELVPSFVIWEGASMDFGEYVEMLPAGLLSLVRSLFTIAIVLFCAYELKGIISYCLTLRESRGG